MQDGYQQFLRIKAKTIYGFDNQLPPNKFCKLDRQIKLDDENTEVYRCMRDICLFEHCVNPLKLISLVEYEKCLKRLSCGDEYLTLKQIKSSFKNIPKISKDICDPNSLLYKMITDPIF